MLISTPTDRSKMDCGVDDGIVSNLLYIQKSHRLPDRLSVFQAETLAIIKACELLNDQEYNTRRIEFASDRNLAEQ